MLVSDYSPVRFNYAYSILLQRYLHKVAKEPLTKEEKSSINLRELDKLVRKIYQATGHLGFGLDIGKQIHPSDYGIAGYAVLNCKTLLEAIQKSTQYRRKLKAGFLTQLDETDELVRYSVKNCDDLICLFPMIELDFASGLQFAKLAVGPSHERKVKLKSVSFKHLPLRPIEDYEKFFACPVYFEAESNAIELDRASAELPVHGANPKLFQMFDKKLGHYFVSRNSREALPEQLSHYLRQHLDQEFPNQTQAAKHFYMSVSCLKNRLKKQGTSFQQILDSIRLEEAKRLLSDSEQPIKEISSGLGFANQSAFNRAFKRWTGLNPRDFRTQLRADSSIPA